MNEFKTLNHDPQTPQPSNDFKLESLKSLKNNLNFMDEGEDKDKLRSDIHRWEHYGSTCT
jgi:hypothetical protein